MGILNTREGFEKCGAEYSRMEAQGNQIGLVCKGEVGRKGQLKRRSEGLSQRLWRW